MRANYDTNRHRPFGHRGGFSSARPDPGRGNIMPGSRARDIRRRREDRRQLGHQRGPQAPRSLLTRITVDGAGRAGGRARGRGLGRGHNHHHAQGAADRGGRGQAQARPLADRITGGNGAGMGRVGTQAAEQNVSTVSTNTAAPGNGNNNNNNVALPDIPQQFEVASEVGAQEPEFPFDPLFDEPTESPAPRARAPVNVTARTLEVRTATANNNHKPIRAVKNPLNRISNRNLRNVFAGIKSRPPKNYGAPMLRVANATHTLQGHELTCSSPAHSAFDGYDAGDDD
ncbi:hypothetical protein PMIN01_00849 [Paraphaeosphaeria minitans]|uniref:Uncharacterized protein n=1 Tax=Paraphaeosphaeria minitans TaxID=565426 RepID=A0A9P6KWD5_9PLEO|nr:hypothetical protein PMIN01_00849 [Paraphaeosphaeria minitans]